MKTRVLIFGGKDKANSFDCTVCELYKAYKGDVSSQVFISYCQTTSIRNCSTACYINHVATALYRVDKLWYTHM